MFSQPMKFSPENQAEPDVVRCSILYRTYAACIQECKFPHFIQNAKKEVFSFFFPEIDFYNIFLFGRANQALPKREFCTGFY